MKSDTSVHSPTDECRLLTHCGRKIVVYIKTASEAVEVLRFISKRTKQDHIRRLLRHVRSRYIHRDTEVSLLKCRRIVDAVSCNTDDMAESLGAFD